MQERITQWFFRQDVMSMIKAYKITSDMVEAMIEWTHNTLKPQIGGSWRKCSAGSFKIKGVYQCTMQSHFWTHRYELGRRSPFMQIQIATRQIHGRKNLWEPIKQKCVASVSGSPPHGFLGTEQTSWGMDNWAIYKSFCLICTAVLVRNTTFVPVVM